jgi:tetratricopeptide (TPR) repeat protein
MPHLEKPGQKWRAACKAILSLEGSDMWLSAADIAQTKLGGCTGNEYRRWLRKSVGRLEVTEPALLDAIKVLNCRLATTSYDGLLLLCAHMGSQPETWRNPDAVAEILTGETHDVWYIHGYWNNAESVIFSNADYVRVGNSELAQFLQHHAAFADTLIFIGCSADGLADQNVGKLLEWFDRSWGGLGKNHFVLITDSEVNASNWPPAVTRVPYGAKHEDLPAFLRSLAPASVSVSSIEYIIGNPRPIGRIEEIARVVSAALDRRPCIITGAPGMGKSTVAVAAAYDPQIIERFGKRRVVVNLEHRSDPLDLLILLASELGLTPEPTHNSTLAAIRHACELAPAFAILDNAEGLIEANEAETSRLLGLLRDTPGLSFVIISFENLPGLTGWERLDDLSPLIFDEARSLFCGIATKIQPDDPDLQPLLEALDGHALSLTIVAGRVDGEPSLKPMLERWNVQKGLLLQDRRTSVRASLRLSLTSRHMTPIAKRLLTVLGFLPDGIPAGGLKAFLGGEDLRITHERSDEATDALRRLRLIPPRADRSLKLLNPLRECVAIECPLKNPDLERVVSAGLKLLEKGKYVGTDKWPAARAELLPHIGNFAPILVEAGRHWINKVLQVIEPARRLSERESRFDQAAFLELATLLTERGIGDSKKGAAAALGAAGSLALLRDDLDGAKKQLEAAREMSVQSGWSMGEAQALHSLGDLAGRRDDLDGAKEQLEKSLKISVQIGWRMGEARALESLGDLALRRYDLDVAEKQLEKARDIYVRIGFSPGEAAALVSLGDLALRRDDLDGAKTQLEAARDIYVRIGFSPGEAAALVSLGDLALRRDDLDGAKTQLEAARDIVVRLGHSLGEANTAFIGALASTREDMVKAEAMFGDALKKYQTLNDAWGTAHSSLRLAQIVALRGDFTSLPAAAAKVLAYETSHPSKRAGPGWRTFCASLTETDSAKHEALRDEARAAWTGIGALGLVRDYLDFKMELKP